MHARLTLKKFQARLDALRPRVVSFDVFDTLLTRTFAHPTHLFLACGDRLREAGMFSGRAADFRHFRGVAERRARARHAQQEPTFLEIYAELAALLGWSAATNQQAQEIELALETRALIPVPVAAACLALCRERGLQILFLSDMYLPSTFISSQLQRHGIALDSEPVFVSCEKKAAKHDGALFDLVREQLALTPAEWLHLGDHDNSDHTRPARRGIHTWLTTDARLSSIEESYLPFSSSTRGLAGHFAAASRAARLVATDADDTAALTAVGAGLLGPILVSFAAWLFAQARARGIQRLYFVSRDGQVIRELARRLQARLPDVAGLECRYLHGSRLAWHHASLHAFTPRHLAWILDPLPKVSFSTVADRLGIPLERLRPIFAQTLGPDLLGKEKWNADEIAIFARELVTAEAEVLVLFRGENRVGLARRYFEQEGLLDGTPSAIVELGWKGRMLTSLVEALGVKTDVQAFYLGLSGFDEDRPAHLQFESFLIEPDGLLMREGRGLRLAELLEVLASADHATVAGYRETDAGRVEPRLKTGGTLTWSAEDLRALRAGAEAFAESLPEEAVTTLAQTMREPDASRLLAQSLLGVLADFSRDPDPELAAVFTRCRFTEDATDADPRPFIAPLDARTAREFRGDLSQLWPQGTLAISKGTWRALALRGWSSALSFAWQRATGKR